ncbi:MAG: UDP-N-acetylglucosamine 2-epimerase (non-hydrolyzing) [Rhodococcus sp.]|nr:UDP-N-acetylglucosamine 2-epimerase (non-hydrolyzing) [Rhodococcus sp. (in: high G+C Gram-positive bacteria)]
MKVMTIVGARPQFIKASVLSMVLAEDDTIEELLVNTGQHYDWNMASVFFTELGLREPFINLAIGSGPHGRQTGEMLVALEPVIEANAPDAVLVYGDTNSTLAGALAAAKLHVPIAHVEAGLRSFNKRMPEEINRILTDHCSQWLFAPTVTARDNLLREGIAEEQVFQVGDIMLDVALTFGERAVRASNILERLQLTPGDYVLATIHRAENTDDAVRLSSLLAALERVAESMPVVLPLHPRTRTAIGRMPNGEALLKRLNIVEPLGFLDMLLLEKKAAVIATDSGGVQKEAFFHQVPCVTLRDETEWVELVELGWNRLVDPTDAKAVAASIRDAVGTSGVRSNPYGDGCTARSIKQALLRAAQ